MPTLAELDAQIADLEGQIATAQQGGAADGPDYSSFFKSPGYQFRLDEGVRAIDRSASARGMLMSGGIQRELTRYGQGLASAEFNTYANRLSALAGIGQTANQSAGQFGSAAAGQVGQTSNALAGTIQAGGTAQAGGIIGSSNALTQGLQGALGSFNPQQFGNLGGGYTPSPSIPWGAGTQVASAGSNPLLGVF